MKVLFLANLPAPYRRLFFSELGKKCELTVIYERESARDRNNKWVEEKRGNYKEIFLKGIKIGDDNSLSFEIIKYLKKEKYDRIIVGMYSTFTAMIAISYLQIKHIPFYLSTDGGFISEESKIKYHIKRHFIGAASYWLSTGEKATDYLVYYGAKRDKVSVYPFSSLTEDDLNMAKRYLVTEKKELRQKMGMTDEKILLTIGRFTYECGYGKGYNTLLKVAERLDETIGIYIVGDNPTDELIQWKEQKKLNHVHFIGLKEKNEMALYYAAADAFILLTKVDVWESAIKEARLFALPIITTMQCNTGTELVLNGENGCFVEAGDVDATERAINSVFSSAIQISKMSQKSLANVQKFAIENKVEIDIKIFKRGYKTILEISEEYVVLAVGQFIYRKGFDVLLKAASGLPNSIGIYLVGGTAPNEYLRIVNENKLHNVHFIDFLSKEEIAKYYKAADVFVLPTREDIWGLVINEAMSYGVPVVTTEMCGAGVELIDNGENGFIVPVDDPSALIDKIMECIRINRNGRMTRKCLVKMSNYTINKMAEAHMKILR